MPEIHVSPATDESLAPELARVINDAYAIGEADLWNPGTQRTTAADVAGHIRANAMLVARSNGRVLGCATVRPVDAETLELGLVSTVPDQWGNGVGSELVRAADEAARSRGAAALQLKLLVPRDRPHPGKDRLRAWYERFGYELAGSLAFEDVSKQDPAALALPCEFLVLRKPLA